MDIRRGELVRRFSMGCVKPAVAFAVVISLLAPQLATAEAPLAPSIKNGLASIYTYDHAIAFLGLQFGVDPAVPLIPVSGVFGEGGFSWLSTGSYLGASYDFKVTGTYDAPTDTVSWNGSGYYGGVLWAFEGASRWTAADSFSTTDNIAFDGVAQMYSSDLSGNSASNTGNCATLTPNVVRCSEDSRGWWKRLFGSSPTVDRWDLIITTPGSITVNTELLIDNGSGVGVIVALETLRGVDASIKLTDNGYSWLKTTVVTTIPEPETSTLLLAGLGAIGLMVRRIWQAV